MKKTLNHFYFIQKYVGFLEENAYSDYFNFVTKS